MAKVLLVAEALIRGDQQLVAVSLRTIEQCSIAQIRPTSLEGRVHRVPGQMVPQRCRGTLIEQYSHERADSMRVSRSWSSTARSWCRSTPGNHSRTGQSWRRPADSRTAQRPASECHGTPRRRSPSPGRVLRRGRSSRCSWPRLLFCSRVDPIRARDDPLRRRAGEAGGTRAPGRAPAPDGLLPACRDESPRDERGSPLLAHDPVASIGPKLTPEVTPYGADARAIPGHPWKRKSANSSAKRTVGRHRTRVDRWKPSF